MNLRAYQMRSKQIFLMDVENYLYTQGVMIRRRESDDKKEKYKTKKYNFQGKSARTKHWFYIDHEWLKDNFITREPDFYKTISN